MKAAATALLLLAGCAAAPTVELHQMGAAPRGPNWVPFRLTDTSIVIGKTATPPEKNETGTAIVLPVDLRAASLDCDASGCDETGLAVIAAPIDDMRAVYAMDPRTRGLVSTSIAPTYLSNSLRLRELAVAVKDHRVEAIKAIGTLAVTAAKLGIAGDAQSAAVASTVPLKLPIIIDLADATAPGSDGNCRPEDGLSADGQAAGGPGCHKLPRNDGWSYRLRFVDGDPAAQGFIPRAQMRGVRGAMVTSACRRAVIGLDHADASGKPTAMATLGVTVADPDWLLAIPIPAKGELVFHSLCGADIKREAVTEDGADDMAQALANSVDALRAVHGNK